MMRSSEISYFLSFCIEQYKQKHRLTGEQAMKELDKYGVLDYLEPVTANETQEQDRTFDYRPLMRSVTQDNLYLLLPSKVSWVADMLCADEHISVVEAMRKIYASGMYKQLEIERTKLWHEGPVSLYQAIHQQA